MKHRLSIGEFVTIVLVIILFVAILWVVTAGARAKSRDMRRVDDMQHLHHMLRTYYTNGNRFPIATEPVALTGDDTVSRELIDAGVTSRVHTDPRAPAYTYTYQSTPTGNSYTITFCLETDTVEHFAEGCSNTISP